MAEFDEALLDELSQAIQLRKIGRGQPEIYGRKRGQLATRLPLANPDRDIFRRAVWSRQGNRVEDIVVPIDLSPIELHNSFIVRANLEEGGQPSVLPRSKRLPTNNQIASERKRSR